MPFQSALCASRRSFFAKTSKSCTPRGVKYSFTASSVTSARVAGCHLGWLSRSTSSARMPSEKSDRRKMFCTTRYSCCKAWTLECKLEKKDDEKCNTLHATHASNYSEKNKQTETYHSQASLEVQLAAPAQLLQRELQTGRRHLAQSLQCHWGD